MDTTDTITAPAETQDLATAAEMDALFREAGFTGFEVAWLLGDVILASVSLEDWAAIERAPKDEGFLAAVREGKEKAEGWQRVALYAVCQKNGRTHRVLLHDREKGADKGRIYVFQDDAD